MERKLNRRRILGRIGGAGLATALVVADRQSLVSAGAPEGTAALVVRGVFASARSCGQHFSANIQVSPDADGMIDGGVFQVSELTARVPSVAVGKAYPVVGTFSGRTLDLRVAVDDQRYITFHGVTNVTAREALDNNAKLEAAGTFSGPIGCATGSWTTVITDDSEWCEGCGCCGGDESGVTPVAIAPTQTPPDTTPEPTAAATFTPEPSVTATYTPEPSATATYTPEPSATATYTPEPTATATNTPEPTPTEVTCPDPEVWNGEECVCPDGYDRVDGTCVLAMTCGTNEVSISPPPVCEYSCVSAGIGQCLPIISDNQTCFCIPGTSRSANGICILTANCPQA